ncbi:5496_t:CDS:2, partial [Entrophospora sp. SA101]
MKEGNFLTQCWNSKGMYSLPFFCFYEEKDANGERIEEELGYYARNNHLSGLAMCRAGNGALSLGGLYLKSNQAQGRRCKTVWKDVELKKIESENKLLGIKIKQAEKKLDYALNSNSALKNIRKHLADGEGMENILVDEDRSHGFLFSEELLTLPFSLVHSFIIDIEDTFIKDEFTGERISEIVEKRNGQSRPEIDEKLFEYINTFAKVRRLVWPVLKEKTDTGPWQYIGPTQQKAIGKKGDAYVRMFGSTSTGWVASEAGQKWEGAHGTKFMEET